MDKHAMDVDTAETLAGVVRLLRQAALRAWAATDRAGARSPGQLFAFGPMPACGEPAGLLMSAEPVWAVSWPAWDFYHLDLVVRVVACRQRRVDT
jgi:hypothetical protein